MRYMGLNGISTDKWDIDGKLPIDQLMIDHLVWCNLMGHFWPFHEKMGWISLWWVLVAMYVTEMESGLSFLECPKSWMYDRNRVRWLRCEIGYSEDGHLPSLLIFDGEEDDCSGFGGTRLFRWGFAGTPRITFCVFWMSKSSVHVVD